MKPRRCSAVVVTWLLALVAGEGCTAANRRPADPEVQAAVAREVDRFRVAHQIPGLSVAVLEGGRAMFVRGFGWADPDRRTPVTPRTMFPIGSVEKQFTAAATMRLVDQGKLSLDDPISKFLPRLQTGNGVVRIEQMLHQISGLPVISEDGAAAAAGPNPGPWGPGPDAAVGAGFSSADDIGGLYGRALYFPPGERFSYSQPNYDLLCYVLASLTGRTYYEAIGDVAASAGLERFHAAWTPRPPADDPDVAAGYRLAGGGPEVAWEPNLGSAWTTALDLARWSEALAAGQVVSKASYERMTTPARLNDGRAWPYGFGLGLLTLDGRPRIVHTGRVLGFYAVLAHYPDDSLTIAIMANLDGASGIATALEPRIARLFLGLDEPRVRDRPLRPEEAARYVGSYDAGAFRFDVVPDGQRVDLIMRLTGAADSAEVFDRRPLSFQGGGRFVAEGAPEWREVSFTPVDGRAMEVALGYFAQGVRRIER